MEERWSRRVDRIKDGDSLVFSLPVRAGSAHCLLSGVALFPTAVLWQRKDFRTQTSDELDWQSLIQRARHHEFHCHMTVAEGDVGFFGMTKMAVGIIDRVIHIIPFFKHRIIVGSGCLKV